jgi:hypothetical protein
MQRGAPGQGYSRAIPVSNSRNRSCYQRDMKRLVVLVATIVGIAACAETQAPPKVATNAEASCSGPQMLFYVKPACGPAAVMECHDIPPPALGIFCGCDGKTYYDMAFSRRPFASRGECP